MLFSHMVDETTDKFLQVLISSQHFGQLFALLGADAFPYGALQPLHSGSAPDL